MNHIKFLESVMYGIMEADTDTIRDLLMLYEADDTEIDALQDAAKAIWEKIAFYHNAFALMAHDEIDIIFDEIIDGTENLKA